MTRRAIVLAVGVLLLLPLAVGQTQTSSQSSTQNSQDLPSAPSAVKMRQMQPAKPAPPPQPQPNSGTQPATPATSGAEPSSSNPSAPAPPESVSTQPAPAQPESEASPTPPPAASKPTPPDDEDPSVTTIRKRVDEVNVIFTVTDKHGRYVKDLKKNDFRVLDDRQPQSQVVSFNSETNLPLRVGLLIDASNSVRDRFKFEQAAAIEFLNQIIRPNFDKAFTIGFDTTPEVTQDFTDNTEALSKGVRMLRPGGGTAMYDALYYACRDKLAKTRDTGSVRRAIILLTDGEDNQSHVTREEAIEMAQRAEVIVYTISTNISGMKTHGDKVLERIADASGGRAFFPFKVEDVTDAFTQIQDELRSQYALSYRPVNFKRDGAYHSIEILAENHKDMHVRARRGYYAPSK
ncbi:MAG TPA: VWA domain-containing protein [Terriglobales bacterium]|jgi:VWFA-related protein|nr:VWA domain-containing protein [Terriglobales bacterium]